MKRPLVLLLAISGCAQPAPIPAPLPNDIPVAGAWVELGPEGALIARTVAEGPGCPTLDTNLGPAPMDVRVAGEPGFPSTCEKRLVRGTTSAKLGDRPLPLLPSARGVKRIIVIGDTGCRLKEQSGQPAKIQNCVSSWPFAQIAEAAAKLRPDLVIHVGDYHYRESPCPEGNAGCAGSIAGDVWGSWYQDFFKPAAPLLSAAPWVFVRGNHESCARAGKGYFRLLDPRPLPAQRCQDSTPPYMVSAGKGVPPLAVLDSSFADVTAATLAPLAKALEEESGPGWLLTHRPPWVPLSMKGDSKPLPEKPHPAIVDDENEDPFEAATIPEPVPAVGVPAGIELVLSGHRHAFEAMSFADGRAPLIDGGDSGTALDTDLPTGDFSGDLVDTTRLKSWTALSRFGFIVLEARGAGVWKLSVRDPSGVPLKSCRLTPPPRRARAEGMKLKC